MPQRPFPTTLDTMEQTSFLENRAGAALAMFAGFACQGNELGYVPVGPLLTVS